MASTIAYVDELVVNVALPAIGRDLAASPADLQWVINAYTLCLAAFLLVGGAAGDRLGRRRVFIAGVALFGAASLGCGLSRAIAQLIAARAVQGAGAALLIPCSLALIGAAFPENERGRAIGTWAGFSAIAAAIGPLLGGWIVDHLAWQAIFFINPVLCLAALWIAWRHLPESIDPEAPAGIDWLGALLAFAGLAGVAFGLIALPDTGPLDPDDGGDPGGRRRPAGDLRVARGAHAGADDAARPVPLGHLQRRQCAHAPALWRPGRRLVPAAVRAHLGSRLFGHAWPARCSCPSPRSWRVVALVGRPARPGRRPPAAGRRPIVVAGGFALLALAGPQTSVLRWPSCCRSRSSVSAWR